jgi:hypothetical protein
MRRMLLVGAAALVAVLVTPAVAFATTLAQAQPSEGTPFLGPIGWLWNEIYYTIFQGSTILMVMFGWELFLAPVILVFCTIAVFRGTSGLLKKPYVPPELRTER